VQDIFPQTPFTPLTFPTKRPAEDTRFLPITSTRRRLGAVFAVIEDLKIDVIAMHIDQPVFTDSRIVTGGEKISLRRDGIAVWKP